jgi:hypothetical protein
VQEENRGDEGEGEDEDNERVSVVDKIYKSVNRSNIDNINRQKSNSN